LQSTDWLAYLGFQRNDRCSFTSFQRCYSKWVNEDFNVEEFATGFNAGFGHLDKAQRALQAVGSICRSRKAGDFTMTSPVAGRTEHREFLETVTQR
jgi:hypothetical protein